MQIYKQAEMETFLDDLMEDAKTIKTTHRLSDQEIQAKTDTFLDDLMEDAKTIKTTHRLSDQEIQATLRSHDQNRHSRMRTPRSS